MQQLLSGAVSAACKLHNIPYYITKVKNKFERAMAPTSTSEEVRAWVSDYYGKQLKASKDLKTNACCASGKPPKWIQLPLSKVHPSVSDKFYGCGFPFPEAMEGCVVADLVSCDIFIGNIPTTILTYGTFDLPTSDNTTNTANICIFLSKV